MLIHNRYKLQKQLGQGGMGTVYLGLDTQNNTFVAIKETVILPSPNEQKKFKRLQREFEFSQQISHPNIVRGLAFFEFQNTHYIIMEYVEGFSIEQIIHNNPRSLPPRELLHIAIQICDAIACLNEQGIVHRDIKPQNIMITHDKTPKILDLGIAKDIETQLTMLTQEGSVIGTFPYMSPEQFSTGASSKTDTFSLGIMLYQLFLWLPQSPYFANTPVQVMDKITKTKLPPLTEMATISDPIYQKISPILQKALEIDVQKRLTVRELTKRLQNVLRGKSTTRKTTKKHLRQTERRRQVAQQQKRNHHILFIAATGSILLLLFFTAFSSAEKKSPQTSQILHQAQKLLDKKEYNAAKDVYQKLLRAQPKNPQIYHKLATISELTQDRASALDYLDQAIELNTHDPQLYYQRGKILQSIHQKQRATHDAQQAINLSPETVEYYILLGNIYQDIQQYEKAIKAFEVAIDLDASCMEAFKGKGIATFAQGYYTFAVGNFSNAIRLSPQDPELYNLRGEANSKCLFYDRALKDFNAAIKYAPENKYYYNNRGLCYSKMRNNKKALKDFAQAINIDNSYADAYNNHGMICLDLQRNKRALKDFKKALEHQQSAMFYNNCGVAYNRLGDFAQAIQYTLKALELDRSFYNAHKNLGMYYANVGNWKNAVNYLSQAININKVDFNLYLARARAWTNLKQNQRAIQDYNIAIQLKPDLSTSLQKTLRQLSREN
ncbi:serine/threonine-protein kinase [Candidatus Uabimicrobium amorphum]|uniref:Serine/threonine protein kinase n=1 Tax=Uabimicrobium amorphum TaxID=2596890 RepID=A0A5S9II94_UABAM|nr:serine/threonine-protein kinase [Candidatus Uabimicrobium amorphum]BBM82319.1 serine/threonine protein kinase [Candidatus Uabimicrobium amorphum]